MSMRAKDCGRGNRARYRFGREEVEGDNYYEV